MPQKNFLLRICQSCGKSYHGRGKKYCSRKCHGKARSKSQKKSQSRENNYNWKGRTKITCLYCNKQFEVIHSRSTTAKFCSPKCRRLSRRNRIKRICKKCGAEFETTPSKTKIEGYSQFCSKKCANSRCTTATKGVPRPNTRGKNHPRWKGGTSFYPYCPKFNKALKERVRAFFGNKCVLCERTSENNWGAALSVHHVFTEKMACCESKIEEMEAIRKRLPPEITSPGAPEFTELEITYIRMLVPLCKQCHGKVEAESLDIPFHETKYRKFFAELIMKHFGGKCF